MPGERAHFVLCRVGDDLKQPWSEWTAGIESTKCGVGSHEPLLRGVGSAIGSSDGRSDT